jgi:hypothetical protein
MEIIVNYRSKPENVLNHNKLQYFDNSIVVIIKH